MRKNRTALRKTLVDPLIKKRQEALSDAMQQSMLEKSGSTMVGLKSVFSVNLNSDGAPTSDNLVTPASMEEEGEDVEIEEKPKVKAKRVVVSSQKPRSNKQLVWFK